MNSKLAKLVLTAGIGLALVLSFSCSSDVNSGGSGDGGKCGDIDTLVDTRDNKPYKFVKIGSQTWMAENLNYRGIEPDTLGRCYDYNEDNCDIYGRLYDWETAVALPGCNDEACASQITANHQGICPDGWHIPSDAEWGVLVQFVNPGCSFTEDNCRKAGQLLKSVNGWKSGGKGEDKYCFSALPGGSGGSDNFAGIGSSGEWWSSTETVSDVFGVVAYRLEMIYAYAGVGRSSFSKGFFYSVRCLQN